MLGQVFAQQPGASCIALQAVARISTRRSIIAAAQVAAAGDAALAEWVEEKVRHQKALVRDSAQLAAGCFAAAGESSSQQQQATVAAYTAAEQWPAAFGLLITAFKAMTYAVQQHEEECTYNACHLSCAALQCICQVPNSAAADKYFDLNSGSSSPVDDSNMSDVTVTTAAAAAAFEGSSTGAADSGVAGAGVATCSSSSSSSTAAGELGVLQLLLVSHSLLLLAQAMEAAVSAEQPAATEEAEQFLFQTALLIKPGRVVEPLECITVAAQWLQRSLQTLSGHAADGVAADASAAAAAEPGGSTAELTGAAAAAEPAGVLSHVPPQLLAWMLRQCIYVAGRQERIRWEQYHEWLQSQESDQQQQEQQQPEELQQQREKQQDKKPRIALQLAKRLQQLASVVINQLPQPHCCNNPGCRNLEGLSEHELVSGKSSRCSGCKVARYCSRECQTEHWGAPAGHKAVCKRLRAAAAAT
jgi:hypothetical protein